MKLRITKLRITIGSIAVALMFAVVFSACESEIIDTSKPQAELLSLRVAGLVMTGINIPAPIPNIDWVDEDADLYGADFKTLSFKYEEDIVDAEFIPTVSPGAKVKWGIANRTVRPGDFYDTRVPATFDARDFLYFQVTSKDDEITNYYRFSTYLSSPVKELSSIKVAGREFGGDITKDVTPADIWNELEIGNIGIHITESESQNVIIDAVPWDPTATLRYAVTPYAAGVEDRQPPVFDNSNIMPYFDDGQLLYIEVAAENTDINIYCFRVYVGRIATVGTLTFINPGREAAAVGTGTFEALGKGTAKNVWTDNSGAGSFDSPHQPDNGFNFAVELDDPAGSWQYAQMNGLLATEPTWSASQNSGSVIPNIKFSHEDYLAIRVTPPNRQGSRPYYFYKVKIGLLAAEFTVQPKSHVYQVNTTADALTFTLDRTVDGATYQWYEANSWYGGYGFDSEGRIGGKKEAITPEANWGAEDAGVLKSDGSIEYLPRTVVPGGSEDPKCAAITNAALDELAAKYPGSIKFNVSGWHQVALDEKDNVSLHNGGNMYYNLPTPGKPIPGATGATYTPPVSNSAAVGSGQNRRPFITNFSNESHYYWVVVTGSDGLKAVSARAVVVTEWGEVYKNGAVVPDDEGKPTTVDKKHYMIDLYAYQTPGVYGLQDSPRNVTPFIAGNHGDKYLIPVDFPADFDIFDYSVFTAQALFFLADGREWIQNWTQGDIGFAKKARDEDGNLTGGEPEEIVLWYNLTNDNATRGLASSGNQPQGSGLSVIPEYIVVKPAGTKPLNQMPPFSDGLEGRDLEIDSVGRIKPFNNNNAQGWFTPYIELSELRFEGPAREKPED